MSSRYTPCFRSVMKAGRIALLVGLSFLCTAPGSLDTHLCYAAWRSSYSSRASIGV